MSRALVLLALLAASACARDADERRAVLEEAQRANTALAQGDVVRDLRAPSDTGRLVYDTAVSLRERPARAAGARQVWAPFGIARPDTVAPATPRTP